MGLKTAAVTISTGNSFDEIIDTMVCKLFYRWQTSKQWSKILLYGKTPHDDLHQNQAVKSGFIKDTD